jgi:biotin carboxyl carrier protein
MTFEVEVAGRVRTVSIEPADRPGRFHVTVDGRTHLLDVARTGGYGLSVLGSALPDAASVTFSTRSPEKGTVPVSASLSERAPVPVSVDLQVTPGALPGEVLVNLEGRTATVTLNGRRARHGGDGGAHAHGEQSIAAPMPGRVVRVLVTVGQDVEARQGVVVVEAMKMENELRAPRAGRVKEISVTPGTSVEAGRVLAVIE